MSLSLGLAGGRPISMKPYPLKLNNKKDKKYLKISYCVLCTVHTLGCVSLRKSKIGFLNPNESENGFCVSLLNRSIQDFSDHGASKEPKKPLPEWILWFLCTLIRDILD